MKKIFSSYGTTYVRNTNTTASDPGWVSIAPSGTRVRLCSFYLAAGVTPFNFGTVWNSMDPDVIPTVQFGNHDGSVVYFRHMASINVEVVNLNSIDFSTAFEVPVEIPGQGLLLEDGLAFRFQSNGPSGVVYGHYSVNLSYQV